MISTVRSVSVPTLVIHGAEDRVVNVRNAGILRDVLAVERKVVVVPDGDHNLTREGDLRLLRDEIPSWISSHADPGRKRVESR
jgi:pimeloyl-ACP methyl ester carboxylesterase